MFKRQTKFVPEPIAFRSSVTARTEFPPGLAIRTEKGVYFIKGQTRFRFFSERVFSTWSLIPIEAQFSAIKHFLPGAGPLGFRDGTLINNVANGRMYLVSGNKKRHIVDPDVFEKYGLDQNRVVVVSDEEAALHSDGEVLK